MSESHSPDCKMYKKNNNSNYSEIAPIIDKLCLEVGRWVVGSRSKDR